MLMIVLLSLTMLGRTAAATLEQPSDIGEEPAQIPQHAVSLPAQTIGAGESVSFTTVAARFEGQELPEGYYAGALTVTLEGTIVVEAGGLLSIGTLSVGGGEESPVLQAAPGSGAQIVVKPGGQVDFVDVTLAATDGSYLIVQEPGASVLFTAMTCPEGLVSWSEALVYNPEETVDDLWLEAGTVLTADLLPQTQTVNVQLEGRETEQTLPIAWDLHTYDGQADGTLTLSGTFLDENQAPLISFAPLSITVHWYQPEELAVTDVIWDGKNAPSASLVLLSLPEEAEVWGEVSADGESWSRWEDFDLTQAASGAPVAVFALPDDTQRYFRVVAADDLEGRFWHSQAVCLPEEESEDIGGNHGGSITPFPPLRDPEPVPELEPEPEVPQEPVTVPEETPEETLEETPEETPESTLPPATQPEVVQPETPAPTQEPEAEEEEPEPELSRPQETPKEELPLEEAPALEEAPTLEEVPASEEAEPEEPAPAPVLSKGSQALLVAAGVVICLGAAGLTALLLHKRKPQ